MSFVKFPPQNTTEAIAVFKQDVGIVHDVAHGTDNQEVLTENGLIPSIAKFIKDTNERIDDGVIGLNHNSLANRTDADAHSIGSITGLSAEIASLNNEVDLKSDLTYVNTQLGLKVDTSDLTSPTGANIVGASASGGLTLGSVQDQLNELKALIDASGGGVFRTKFFSKTITVAAGVTGDIIVIPAPPAGQVIRLTTLLTNTAAVQTGISIVAGADTIVSGSLVRNSYNLGDFGIVQNVSVAMPAVANLMSPIVADSIKVVKDAGNTTEAIVYAYEYGVIE